MNYAIPKSAERELCLRCVLAECCGTDNVRCPIKRANLKAAREYIAARTRAIRLRKLIVVVAILRWENANG